MFMYYAIIQVSRQAMDEMEFDIVIVIPSGTSIQNARTNDYLKAVEGELTSDGHHLDHGIGRFIVALTVFETLISSKYKKDLFNDVSFHPMFDGGTPSLSKLAKMAAKYAVIEPFGVSGA